MLETINGVIRLLDSSKTLLLNRGNEAICAGIYTYAVEEYGKFIMLKQCVSVDGQVTINYGEIFKDKRHENKFGAAAKYFLEQAPECILLVKGMFDPAIFDSRVFDVTGPIKADFQTRMAIFYCDLDSKNCIKQVPSVDKARLNNAIDKLKSIAITLIVP